MTEGEISDMLARHFDYHSRLIVPNTFLTGYESDLLIVSKSGYATEVEIKISRADLRSEFVHTERELELWGNPADGKQINIRNLTKSELASQTKIVKHYTLQNGDYRTRKDSSGHYKRGHYKHIVTFYWVAVPFELLDSAIELTPEYAGIICVNWQGKPNAIKEYRQPKRLKWSRKLNEKEITDMARYCCHRYWSQRTRGKAGRK